jgi:hypothetical protein
MVRIKIGTVEVEMSIEEVEGLQRVLNNIFGRTASNWVSGVPSVSLH